MYKSFTSKAIFFPRSGRWRRAVRFWRWTGWKIGILRRILVQNAMLFGQKITSTDSIEMPGVEIQCECLLSRSKRNVQEYWEMAAQYRLSTQSVHTSSCCTSDLQRKAENAPAEEIRSSSLEICPPTHVHFLAKHYCYQGLPRLLNDICRSGQDKNWQAAGEQLIWTPDDWKNTVCKWEFNSSLDMAAGYSVGFFDNPIKYALY